MTPRKQAVVLVAIAAVTLSAIGLTSVIAQRQETAQPPAPPAPPGTLRLQPEQMATIRSAPVQEVMFEGTEITEGKIAVNGDRATPVFSPYSGRVLRVLAKPGDVVARGAPLLEIEASEFVQGQNDLAAAQAALATAQSQLNLAQTSERRKQALYEAKAGSLQDWQQSQAELNTAQNNFRAAQTALASVRNRLHILGKSDDEIESMSPERKMSPVAAVAAPIAGTVTDRQVGPGQYLQAGAANPVFTISDLSMVWLVANVREADAAKMRKGQRIAVQVLALPGRVFEAKVTYVAPAIDAATRRLQVRAEVRNPDGLLKPEMFATFGIDTAGSTKAPGVPDSAIVHEGDEARVWVLQEGGIVASRRIKAGRSGNGLVEVVDGLRPGETVVTAGTLFIDRAGSGD
jgi:cobalt-zinc-cadmium efflux system membrane fusion protein